jgi:hypothetical protein
MSLEWSSELQMCVNYKCLRANDGCPSRAKYICPEKCANPDVDQREICYRCYMKPEWWKLEVGAKSGTVG